MPLRLPDLLPAIEILKKENIFVMDETRAHSQDIRPLRIVILNLMPLKITTETDLVRLLSNTPLQIDISFMKLKSHTPKNTPIEHMMMFYKDFETLSKQKFDGMIVTGAPVEDCLLRTCPIGMRSSQYSIGHVLMSPPRSISVGRRKQRCIISMAYQSIHCPKSFLVFSHNIPCPIDGLSSEDLMTYSSCLIVVIVRYARMTSMGRKI